MLYPVCVHQDGNGSLGAVIPDFPGCFSGADDWQDLPRMVREAIEVHCEGEDLEIPAPSSLDELRDNPDYEGGQWVFVDVDRRNDERLAHGAAATHRRRTLTDAGARRTDTTGAGYGRRPRRRP